MAKAPNLLLLGLLVHQVAGLMGVMPDDSLATHNLSWDLPLLLMLHTPDRSSTFTEPANATQADGASPPQAAALPPSCYNPFGGCTNQLCALILVPCLFPDNEDISATAAHFVFQDFDPCAEVWAFGTLSWDAWCEQHVWDANYRADMMHERLFVCYVAAPSGQQQQQEHENVPNHQQQQEQQEEQQEAGWPHEPSNSTAGRWQWAASSVAAPAVGARAAVW